MSNTVKTTLRGFSGDMRKLPVSVSLAVVEAMREAGDLLAGPVIQKSIDDSALSVVDQGQFRASWLSRSTPDGAVVASTAAHAVFMERGRGPGPVPLQPIRDWVRRHPEMWADHMKGHAMHLRRVDQTNGRAELAKITRTRSQRTKEIKQAATENAIDDVAFLVRKGIEAHGFRGRWVLRRAVAMLEPKLGGILKRRLRGVQP